MFLKQLILISVMENNREERVAQFIADVKQEFAKIPKNLSEAEYIDRAERCLSLSDNLARQDEKMKAKKYQLLAQKYRQLAHEKHPGYKRPEQPQTANAQIILDEAPVEQTVKKENWCVNCWKRFLGVFGGKEVKVEIKEN